MMAPRCKSEAINIFMFFFPSIVLEIDNGMCLMRICLALICPAKTIRETKPMTIKPKIVL